MSDNKTDTLPTTGERFVPELSGDMAPEHLHRYLVACRHVAGRKVLDIASGEGYGSAMLAEQAAHVIGVDIDADSVAHALRHYQRDNLEFRQGDCADIPIPDASVDVVVSFETIEHHDQHREMMAEIRRVLRPHGLLVISSPDKREYSDRSGYRNPFHVHELYRDQFEALLGDHFAHYRVLGQRMIYGSALVVSSESTFSALENGALQALDRPVYLIALASDVELPPIDGTLLLHDIHDSSALHDARRRAREDLLGKESEIDQLYRQRSESEERIAGLESERDALCAQRRDLEAHIAGQQRELEDTLGEHRQQQATLEDERQRRMDAETRLASLCEENASLGEQIAHTQWLHQAYLLLHSHLYSPQWLLKRLLKQLLLWPRRRLQEQEDRRRIAASGLFDADWYRQHNVDIEQRGIDPLSHYLRHGGFEGRSASERFDSADWLRRYPHLIGDHYHPLLHYLDVQQAPNGQQQEPHELPSSSAVRSDDAERQPAINDRLFQQLFADASCTSNAFAELSEHHLRGDTRIRAIALYLPQFHPIEENSRWWGKGFTEWTNVTKAVPQFVGHEQPKLPAELGFYDLRLPAVQERQAELAHQHGIEAFCFHYYWFSGRKRLLETPVDNYVANRNIDFPFCICWANENWTRRWDGQENDVLMAQLHRPEDDLEFIEDLAPLLRDPRYLRVDGRAVLLVYRVDIIPDAPAMTDTWRRYCREQGIGELHLVAAQSFGIGDPRPYGFDAAMEFPPHALHVGQIEDQLDILNPDYAGRVFDYREVVSAQLARPAPDYTLYRGLFPGWDNEARKPGRGHVFHYASPNAYRRWLAGACRHADSLGGDSRLVFLNAWNEWAEGAYLEPDRRHGYASLQATQEVLAQFPQPHALPVALSELAPERRHDTAVILHLYYPELWDEIAPALSHLEAGFDLYISLPEQVEDETLARLRVEQPAAYLLPLPNRGRDVAPFIEIMRRLLPLGYKNVCKVHAKKSVHRGDGDIWREEMFDSLLGSTARVDAILDAFAQHPEVGLIGPAGHWLDYQSFWGIAEESPERLAALLMALGDIKGVPERLGFFAGSMFWCRPQAVAGLIEGLHWQDFEAELGQRDGALGHIVERALGRAVELAGYSATDTLHLDDPSGMPAPANVYRYAVNCPPAGEVPPRPADISRRGMQALRQLARKSTLARRLHREIRARLD
ncbi:glycoside hydrolase family 99-like domain-containing protein [Kushneria aurantia]|uniref:Glycoside hydrolase family 99-like domain-containing protein n=1 Tax=Kushneria aurantia TaxID=504092 RepID=A0ABV6FYX1_9GAMM|nr:glycoside hydrolase family 99-like domain-containing protein [Kushneria aurantia]